MTILPSLSPSEARAKLAAGEAMLIDVRGADEFAREHVRGAASRPLAALKTGSVTEEKTPIFMCRSGNRTEVHCADLSDASKGRGYVLEGGIEGWKSAGLPTEKDRKAPLEIMRQVQITAGLLVLLGVVLGTLTHPGFYGVAAFVGAGLTFAGASGWCGMAKLLGVMPWNRSAVA
ncbi:rhodanese family protein [Parvularcula maris]|uniref:Rhodanese family protein n=1 Tax=Parvularcula maris TaxID=2965077 RepID=A0A9X2RGW5_9PROT|nr:rhodanese family protein [Parvularcula maris]MCQ8184320.1 rhodanese family protein [Parvularcula maris]